MITLFCVIIFEQVKISVGLVPTHVRNGMTSFDIPLFYTSTMPLIFQQMAIEFGCKFSKYLWQSYPNALITRFIGVWVSSDSFGVDGDSFVPVGGLAYYMVPPRSFQHTLADPLHTVVFLIISLLSAGYAAGIVLEIQGPGPIQVARELKMQRLRLPGHREDEHGVEKKLSRDIPAVAVLGGMLLSLVAFVGEMLGAFGSGSSLLIAASVINHAKDNLLQECRRLGRVVPSWLKE
jgi:protein transport protein SEC61 subunit alpha